MKGLYFYTNNNKNKFKEKDKVLKLQKINSFSNIKKERRYDKSPPRFLEKRNSKQKNPKFAKIYRSNSNMKKDYTAEK